MKRFATFVVFLAGCGSGELLVGTNSAADTVIWPAYQSCPAGMHLRLDGAGVPDCQCPDRTGSGCNLSDPDTKCFCDPNPPGADVYELDPHFWLLTVLYSPPGTGSEVTYGAGSSNGSRVEIKTNISHGIDTKVETTGVDFEQKYTIGTVDGWSTEIHQASSYTVGLQSQTDAVDHNKDTLVLWMNPHVRIVDDHVHPPMVSLSTSDGLPPRTMNLTSEEAYYLVPLPPWKQQALAGLTGYDWSTILSANPFPTWQGTPTPYSPRSNPKRWALAAILDVNGPDHPGDPLTSQGIDVSYDQTKGTIHGKTQQLETDLLFGGEFDYGIKVGSKSGLVLDYEFENTTEQTSGIQRTASVKLTSQTLCWHQTVEIWYDAAFGTYAYVPTGPASTACGDTPGASGLVTDASGAPLANAVVTLQLADGTTRKTVTNVHGVYKAWNVPAGAVEVLGPVGATVTPSIPAPPGPAFCQVQPLCGSKIWFDCISQEPQVVLRKDASGAFQPIASLAAGSDGTFNDTPAGDVAVYRVCSASQANVCTSDFTETINHDACPPPPHCKTGQHYCGEDQGCVPKTTMCQ